MHRPPPNLTRIDRMTSVIGGVALLGWSLRRHGLAAGGAAGLGFWLLYQAYTGSNPMLSPLGIRVNARAGETDADETIVLDETISIGGPRDVLYRLWRDLEILPQVAPRLREVRILDERRSRWAVAGPGGAPLEWESAITADQPGERIAWRTTRGGSLVHFGAVRFSDAPADRGTVVSVHIEYLAAAGALGAAVASLTGSSPRRLVREALRRLKQWAETGEIATTAGQSAGAGRSRAAKRLERAHRGDA